MKREQQSYRVTSNLKENTNQEALKIAKIWKLAIILHLKKPETRNPPGFTFGFRVLKKAPECRVSGFGLPGLDTLTGTFAAVERTRCMFGSYLFMMSCAAPSVLIQIEHEVSILAR